MISDFTLIRLRFSVTFFRNRYDGLMKMSRFTTKLSYQPPNKIRVLKKIVIVIGNWFHNYKKGQCLWFGRSCFLFHIYDFWLLYYRNNLDFDVSLLSLGDLNDFGSKIKLQNHRQTNGLKYYQPNDWLSEKRKTNIIFLLKSWKPLNLVCMVSDLVTFLEALFWKLNCWHEEGNSFCS